MTRIGQQRMQLLGDVQRVTASLQKTRAGEDAVHFNASTFARLVEANS